MGSKRGIYWMGWGMGSRRRFRWRIIAIGSRMGLLPRIILVIPISMPNTKIHYLKLLKPLRSID